METTPHANEDTHPANGQSHEITPGVPLGGGSADAPAKADTAVDLAAWARGEREYLFGEVQKAIDDYALVEIQKMVDARFSGITGRREAVRFLIAEGLIDEAEARTDV